MLADSKNWLRERLRTAAAIGQWARMPLVSEDGEAEARRLMQLRDHRFLFLMRHAVYDFPQSPYLKLLGHVGCEYGDLEARVAKDGLDLTLLHLAGQGVYVTHNEMKGREPAQRGSAAFHFHSSDFNNPLIQPDFGQTTSGSTGRATFVGVTFQHFQQQLLHTSLSASFHKMKGAAVAFWLPPCAWAFSRACRLDKCGLGPARWFSQVPLIPSPVGIRKALSTLAPIVLSRMHGAGFPVPRYVSLSNPSPVVNWIEDQLKRSRKPLLVTVPSTALRACALAARKGVSLEGAVLLVCGESVTAARRAAIESAGAACLPLFGATETGESAEGCLAPNDSDDMHVYTHKFAVVSQRRTFDVNRDAQVPLFTTLASATPKIFLNADTGDIGIVEERDCGCPWGQIGFRTHLRSVWSYAKLTAEGTTLEGEAVFSVLEKKMPERFGGQPGDYQLLSEPDNNGITRYLVAVNPSLGPIDEAGVKDFLLAALADGGWTGRGATEFLKRAGQFTVVRRAQLVQSGGKSLPVVLQGR